VTRNPHTAPETHLHPVKTKVSCAVSRCRIPEPIFFENTINSERYNDKVHNFLGHLPKENTPEAWFQQSNLSYSTGNYARTIPVVRRLNHFKRTVPPYARRMSPPDFFSCGTLLNTMFTAIWRNRKPTYPTPLPTLHPWRCRKCLRIRFVVLGYACSMLGHTFRTSCNKTYWKHLA
jgi:hypothetical protein